MENQHVIAVEQMKAYILQHIGEKLSQEQIAASAGYSLRHCKRIFKQYTGKPLSEYVRLLKLTEAARKIISTEGTILDVAMDSQYDSHEGFTKAFRSAFGISPSVYRKGENPIQYFIPYPLQPLKYLNKGDHNMEKNRICTATYVSKPARKLIFLPSKTGKDYWSYCQEMGCDWEGIMASIACRMDAPALLELPADLVPEGFSPCASGIEVPADYSGDIPEGYMTAELPPCEMVMIQSPPYENPDEFSIAVNDCFVAYETYDPSIYGYEFASDAAPSFNFGADTHLGGRIAFPVRKRK